MIIKKNVRYKDKDFIALTDDTRVIESFLKGEGDTFELQKDINVDKILFVRNKQNKDFITPHIAQSCSIIESYELKDILMKDFSHNPPNIVGITGTNGKTTTAAIIYSILLDLGFNVALLGTRGFFINERNIKAKGLTTPSMLELYENLYIAMEKKCDFLIMEVSSHAIEQERIAGLDFALKILTNITSDHLDYHKSVEEYRHIKNSFFESEGKKLLNADEPYVHCVDKAAYFYGIEKKGNLSVDVYALENGIDGYISWRERDSKKNEQSSIQAHLYGKHNLYNALAAIAAVKILTQEPLHSITEALEHFGGVSGRMEVVHNTPLVIVDFAHTHDGMYQIFESFRHCKVVVVFGAGGDRDKSKRPKMGACAQQFAHKIYITSDNPRTESPQSIIEDILSGMQDKKNIFVEIDRKKAIHMALDSLESDEVLLILGKGDEDYQIIGKQKIHFDDREVVRDYFINRT
ncbi:UDP-N-acetylmuramoyl-L-alanyl-D-glutamate--2,6-diaminopimelate ligase [Helicobacter sp. MIT 21-1697]|uniref:UDP-N-acetylmuramoyl-L-alanyl-D-glutamate--2, 6-diaminopimelate ligase n=1 Tax=Helicobacter sp. MIT 21-1697 TaxID=2993733 RepID=UPI00224B9119|nr:UDP-N-acetylmuramoyl-L-alanyl-D-glutamate--2,6-diaminopimelate ligase [Helicobacter sp. MIT 21-1697]MCX2716660.1 UDP-N-acetylmuramoyl-L-alanyl-D-glutamate--2,6-diaminopimelate ligase [Helicobacter sp. MIT 21-1697]